MKLVLWLVGVILVGAFVVAPGARAGDVLGQACAGNKTATSTVCSNNSSQTVDSNSFYGPNGVLLKVTNIVSLIAGIAAVFIIIISGFRYIISAGDGNAVSGAKNALLYAVIGLVIIVIARSIISLVVTKL